ncbi:hypothetical protein FIBSPDRAFT_859732 [Athelia psychrophila]|uniref:Uncharacterized protein n=1 Tax=Athelia psychrophila TaxID=1759441 RepID=A0A166KR60_9AGAM|nr:hypothetical protein FIBSPDRAFT_859732 [Fibularhizoctonia sp. CBS 109695]
MQAAPQFDEGLFFSVSFIPLRRARCQVASVLDSHVGFRCLSRNTIPPPPPPPVLGASSQDIAGYPCA